MFIKMFPLGKWISAFTVLVGTFGYIYANLDPQTWCKMNSKCEMKARAPTHSILHCVRKHFSGMLRKKHKVL